MPAPLRAAFFDMDGTLVDNMSFHNLAWEELSARLGVPTTAAHFQAHFAGRKNDEIFPELLGRPVPPAELARLADEKESRYRELYRPHLALVAGASELVARLRAKGVRLAVATAAPQENRELVLDGLGIRGWFDAVVGAEEVKRGKPDPDIFLRAAERLGVAPGECLVFEDAANGVRAGRAAGMRVVGLTTASSAQALLDAGAEHAVADFTSLPSDLLASLGIR